MSRPALSRPPPPQQSDSVFLKTTGNSASYIVDEKNYTLVSPPNGQNLQSVLVEICHMHRFLEIRPMPHDPEQIANYLIEKHGLDGAVLAALDQALDSQDKQDLYALSVWREVKRFLQIEVEKTNLDDLVR